MAWRNEYTEIVKGLINKYGTGIITDGDTYYVDSATGSDGGPDGKDPNLPLKSIFGSAGAMARCSANHGDYIIALPGHTETIAAAAGGACAKAGVTIIFLGSGSNRARINWTTAVAADVNVSAANVTWIGPLLTAGIDALTNPIHVTGADFHLFDAEWRDGTAIDTTHAIVGSSAATRMIIDGYKYILGDGAGTQKHSHIQLAGGDHVELKNIEIEGNFNVAPIEGTAAVTNINLQNLRLNNTNAGPLPGMNLHANTTGFAGNVKIRVVSGTTYVTSVAKIQWGNDCEGFNTDGYAGDPIGTAIGTGVEGKIDVIDGYMDVPTANTSTNAVMRDVIGNKTDTAVNAVAANKSALAYIKGLINEITVAPADTSTNGFMNDVVGNKTDAAFNTVSSTKSLVAYIKGLIGQTTVATANTSTNAYVRDAVGNKTDSAFNTVSSTKSLMAYVKGLIGQIAVPVADTSTNAYVRDAVGTKTDAAVNTITSTRSIMGYVKGLINQNVVPTANTSTNAYLRDVVGNKSDSAGTGGISTAKSLAAYVKQLVLAADGLNTYNSRYFTVAADFTSATWNTVASHEIATVSGSVRLRILPLCTANLDGAANTLLSLGTSASVAGFIANTTATQIDLKEFWLYATGASNIKHPPFSAIIDRIVDDDDIGYTIVNVAASGGSLRFYVWWEPLETGATVAAGAGGAL